MNKALEDSANRMKEAMLDAEKSFDEVIQWSDTHKQDFIRTIHCAKPER